MKPKSLTRLKSNALRTEFNRDENGKVIRDSTFYSQIGKVGGITNRNKMKKRNPNHFADIGFLGGKVTHKEKGKEFYSNIGSLPKKPRSK